MVSIIMMLVMMMKMIIDDRISDGAWPTQIRTATCPTGSSAGRVIHLPLDFTRSFVRKKSHFQVTFSKREKASPG